MNNSTPQRLPPGLYRPDGTRIGGDFEPNPLTNLAAKIRAHWLKHRPKMCAALEAQGKLEGAIEAATELTGEAVLQLVANSRSKLHLWEAWDMVRQEWAILPSEEDVPVLGSDPATWQPPDIPEE